MTRIASLTTCSSVHRLAAIETVACATIGYPVAITLFADLAVRPMATSQRVHLRTLRRRATGLPVPHCHARDVASLPHGDSLARDGEGQATSVSRQGYGTRGRDRVARRHDVVGSFLGISSRSRARCPGFFVKKHPKSMFFALYGAFRALVPRMASLRANVVTCHG
jgi:hypothetical protein